MTYTSISSFNHVIGLELEIPGEPRSRLIQLWSKDIAEAKAYISKHWPAGTKVYVLSVD